MPVKCFSLANNPVKIYPLNPRNHGSNQRTCPPKNKKNIRRHRVILTLIQITYDECVNEKVLPVCLHFKVESGGGEKGLEWIMTLI